MISLAQGPIEVLGSTSPQSASVSPIKIGNFAIVSCEQNAGTATNVAISGGGVATWNAISPFNGAYGVYLFWGIVTSVTASQTLTATWTGGQGPMDVLYFEYTSDLVGSNATWNVGSSNNSNSATAVATLAWPSITMPVAGQVGYFGFSGNSQYTGTYTNKLPASFTFNIPPARANLYCYGLNLNNNTAYAPSASATSPDTFSYSSVGVAFSISTSLPTNTSLPTVTGNLTVGSVLTANPGTWSPNPSTYSYVWQRENADGTLIQDIPGATQTTYTLQQVDVGKNIRVRVLGNP